MTNKPENPPEHYRELARMHRNLAERCLAPEGAAHHLTESMHYYLIADAMLRAREGK